MAPALRNVGVFIVKPTKRRALPKEKSFDLGKYFFFGQGNLFSRRENKLSHRENIFLHRENLFSRCENNFLSGISCLCIGKKRICHQDKLFLSSNIKRLKRRNKVSSFR